MIAAMSRLRLDFLKALLIAFLAAVAADASPIPRKLDESTPGGDVKCGTCVQSPPPPALVYPSPPPPPVYSPPPPAYSPPPPVYSPPPSPKSNCPPPPSEPSAYNPPSYQPPTNIPGPPGGNLYPVAPLFSGASGSVDASGLAAAIFMSVAVLAALLMILGD